MTTGDFLIPSLLRDFGGWPDTSLADGAADLAERVGFGEARDPDASLVETLDRLVGALEPTLILLSLCGYTTERLVIAGAETDVAVLLGFHDRIVARADVPLAVADALDPVPAVVGLKLTSPRPLAVPLTGLRDGWLVIDVDAAHRVLDLGHLFNVFDPAPAEAALLNEVANAIGDADLTALIADPYLASGALTMFDPTGWSVPSLANPAIDAFADGDPDAIALVELGQAMKLAIDGGPITEFLRDELVRDRAIDTPLRDRFRDDRDERQLLRQGMRGARRRHRTLNEDGLRRAFRLGRSRRLTYTELLMGLHEEEVVDILYGLKQRVLTPTLELHGDVYGEVGQQYLIARLPPPYEPSESYELVLTVPAPESQLSISYRRWGGEQVVAGDVASVHLSLATGRLTLPLQAVDGEPATPTLSVQNEQTLQLAGVQHGDVLVFTDTASAAKLEVAVVKNFSRNDLNRLQALGYALTVAEPLGVVAGLPQVAVDTIEFMLADGADTAQELQRQARQASLANTYPQAHGDPSHAYPATLDVPSARGVGLFPEDASHLHLCLPPAAMLSALQQLVNGHTNQVKQATAPIQVPDGVPFHQHPQLRAEVSAHRQAMAGGLTQVFTEAVRTPGITSIWHTYEVTDPAYLLAGNELALWPTDPVRNLRTDWDKQPTLFADTTQLTSSLDAIVNQGLGILLEVGLFVNRRAQVVLFVDPNNLSRNASYSEVLQVADALASLADGGLPPVGVSSEPGPVEEPEPPPEPPQQTGPGSVLLRVVDDAGNPLPLAWVSITGAASHSIKTGEDGTALLDGQAPGVYTATNTGYPGCASGTVDFAVVPATTVDVELVVTRIPASPDLPPLRGRIAEASGFFVRESPGDTGPKLGKLHYGVLDVTVLEARQALSEGKLILWYRVRFTPDGYHAVVAAYQNEVYNQGDLDELGRLLAALEARQGTEAWVGADGFAVVAMPWDHFLWLLVKFELDHAHEDILIRLSRLRQWGENPDVPGNEAAGLDQVGIVVENGKNITQRAYLPNEWSLLLEAKQVVLPDGEVIDIHHFLLGVEGLIDDGRRSNFRTIYADQDLLHLVSLDIGESYSALTWSGDVAGGVTDMVRHESDGWEEAHVGLPHPDVLDFYLRTRVPDYDLLADIDAWGAYDLMPYTPNHLTGSPQPSPSWQPTPPVATLEELVTEVYGPPGPLSPAHTSQRSRYRAEGIRRMLNQYGFTSATGLRSQSAAVQSMNIQVQIFAIETWFPVKEAKALTPTDPTTWGTVEASLPERIEMGNRATEMVPLFLDRLESLARQLGVTLP